VRRVLWRAGVALAFSCALAAALGVLSRRAEVAWAVLGAGPVYVAMLLIFGRKRPDQPVWLDLLTIGAIMVGTALALTQGPDFCRLP